MSLLIVSTARPAQPASPDEATARTLAEAQRQGFVASERFDFGSGSAWWFATPDNPRGSGAFARVGEVFAACVGTVYWRGMTGRKLLQRLLNDYASPVDMPLDEFSGSFAMLFGSRSGVWLFNDALGIQKVYETAQHSILSTSLMVCRATLRQPQVNRLRAQEYVLLGGTHGRDTPVAGIRIIDPTAALELSGQHSTTPLHPPGRLRIPCAFRNPDEAVEAVSSVIIEDFRNMSQAFGPDIGMALSGGFDSRLLLAALDRVDVQPHLYVYGDPRDADVQTASSIAARLGVGIECFAKRALNAKLPPITVDVLRSNLAFFDGLPPDGVFDRGADCHTRLLQVQGGRLNLNGGGGEILRNFFYLRDTEFKASELVAAFYSNWPVEVFKSDDERINFLDTMRDGIVTNLGYSPVTADSPERALPRSDVELVYSLFRLRYWMGRNNTIAARYGAFITPLPHPRLVAIAASIPIRWKHFGQLEARIIRAISPRIAQGPSAYGFDFSEGPGLAHRLRIASTMVRPVSLRSRSAQIRRALGRAGPVVMPAEWRESTSDLAPPDWIVPEALCDGDQLNRMLTLQALLSDKVCGF